MDYQQILKDIHQAIQPYASIGKQADYIPALAKINPDQFGMCIHTIQGKTFMHGEATTSFSIQSISKVFSLAMCLSLEGDDLWKRVGKEPSGTAFNSLVQLEVEKGIPRNPFINAGAIVMADILLLHIYESGKKEVIELLIFHVVIPDLPGAPFVINVVRRVRHHKVRFHPCHQHIVCLRQSRIPDHQPVPPKRPHISHFRHRRLFQFRVNVKVILRDLFVMDGIE